MFVSARSRVALAASLLLSGCYVGFDADIEVSGSSGGSSTGGSGLTDVATTGDPATSTDPTADSSTDPTADPSVGTTGDPSGDGSTGGIGGTTGDDTTTTGPDTSEPMATTTGLPGDDTTTGADSGMMPPPVDVPDNAHCADVADWSPEWAQLEQDVLTIVNQVRSQGANCGTKGAFAATGPLTMNPALRCAARKHSADMAARNFFDHVNPDGEAFTERMAKAGYGGYSTAGENIAAGSPDAQGTMSQWMGSDGHCANIMNPDFKDIGVGYSTGGQYGHLWTQVFGAK